MNTKIMEDIMFGNADVYVYNITGSVDLVVDLGGNDIELSTVSKGTVIRDITISSVDDLDDAIEYVTKSVGNIRDRAYRRRERYNAITRKRSVAKDIYGSDCFKFAGMYDKGHIGCGCDNCKPSKKFGEPSFEDRKKTEQCLSDISDYWNGRC